MSIDLYTHKHIKILYDAYGSRVLADLLGVTDRAVQIWLESPTKKIRAETKRKVSELFAAHEAGKDLRRHNEVQPPKDDSSKMLAQSILNLTETNKRLAEQGEVNSKTLSRLVDRLLELGSTEFQAFLFGGIEGSKAPVEYLRKKDKPVKSGK